MMTHHDSTKSYDAAATEAGRLAREKLNAILERGRASAAALMDHVETSVPVDLVVQARSLRFAPGEGRVLVEHSAQPGLIPVHRNAMQQIAAREGVPMTYVNDLLNERGAWGAELLAHNLNTIVGNEPEQRRHLLRLAPSAKGGRDLRGFLSDKYRRLDSRPIMDEFIGALQGNGAVPIDGTATDTRIALSAALPVLHEPVPNEPLLFMVMLKASDYGNGAVEVLLKMMRMWCTNGAIGENLLRQVHVGRRLNEDMEFSARTLELDTQTVASAIGDVVKLALSPAKIEEQCNIVRAAHEEKVTPEQVRARLKASGLTKAEQEAATEAFNSPDLERVPAGMTRYRLSNAVSWLAHAAEPERALDLQRFAGAILSGKRAVVDSPVIDMVAA